MTELSPMARSTVAVPVLACLHVNEHVLAYSCIIDSPQGLQL